MISKSVFADPGGSIAGATSWKRRSALVNVPAFSRNAEAGRITSAYLRRLGLEDVLADEELERLERVHDVGGVRVGLRDVLAEDPHRLEVPLDGGVEHLGHLVADLARKRDAPRLLEQARDVLVVDATVGGVGVRQRAHVRGALDVVLAAQRQQRRSRAADLAGHQREVADQLDDLRAVLVLGHAETPDDAGVLRLARRCARPRSRSSGADSRDLRNRVGRVGVQQLLERVVALGAPVDEGLRRSSPSRRTMWLSPSITAAFVPGRGARCSTP